MHYSQVRIQIFLQNISSLRVLLYKYSQLRISLLVDFKIILTIKQSAKSVSATFPVEYFSSLLDIVDYYL